MADSRSEDWKYEISAVFLSSSTTNPFAAAALAGSFFVLNQSLKVRT